MIIRMYTCTVLLYILHEYRPSSRICTKYARQLYQEMDEQVLGEAIIPRDGRTCSRGVCGSGTKVTALDLYGGDF